MAAQSRRSQILIADDQPTTLLVLEEMLEDHFDVRSFSDGRPLIDYLNTGGRADIVLTDVVMPGVDGFEVCRRIKANDTTKSIPVLLISSLDSDTDEAQGLSLGAEDFIHKPFSPAVVLARVRSHLALAEARRQLLLRNEELERLVLERTKEIVRRGDQIIAAQDAAIAALCNLAEIRDNETGNHILRTQHYVRCLALALQKHPRLGPFLPDDTVQTLFKSAPLHDIGKVGIPDAILRKPGKLTGEEWVEMKRHCEYGRDALALAIQQSPDAEHSFLLCAMEIAYSHHERWDGTGYPEGLVGDSIPLAARLMAVADVYDALISHRVYKAPSPHEEAVSLIVAERGTHFDPDVTEAFVLSAETFAHIAASFRDTK